MVDSRTPDVELSSPIGRVLMATVVLGSAAAMLTATVVNIALPTLAADLDAASAAQKWVINGYTLTLASFILIGGSLSDRFGRVRIYRIGVTWFAVASVLCALAWDVRSLIAFRLLQGVGGALLTPGSLAIIQSTLRVEDRGRGVGAWSGITGVASAIGPLVGGALVESSWRWVFVMNIPIALVVLVLAGRVPETRDPTAEDEPLDLLGAALVAVALGGVSYALIEGPEGGVSPIEVVAAIAGVVAIVALWRVERGRSHAILPFDLFGERVFAVCNGLTFAIYGGMGVVFFLLAVQLQVTSEWSPAAAGAALLPVTALMLVLSSKMGSLATRIGPRLPLTIGPLLVAAGMVLMVRIGPGAVFVADVLPATFVFGLGVATIVAPVTSAVLGSVPVERAGSASGVNNAVARTAGLLAVAAIPGLVGLTGDALGDPAQLDAGFDRAMYVSASIVAAAGLVAAFALPGTMPLRAMDRLHDLQHHPCPVDGPHGVVTSARRRVSHAEPQ